MRVEVLDGIERRRRWSHDEKMRILAESLELGATVADSRGTTTSRKAFCFPGGGKPVCRIKCLQHWCLS